jgi:hypothetical protein
MLRPRWHDALIVSAIAGLFAAGIWSLWWDDVRSILHRGPTVADPPAAAAQAQT